MQLVSRVVFIKQRVIFLKQHVLRVVQIVIFLPNCRQAIWCVNTGTRQRVVLLEFSILCDLKLMVLASQNRQST